MEFGEEKKTPSNHELFFLYTVFRLWKLYKQLHFLSPRGERHNMECMQIYANSPFISFHSRFRLEQSRSTYFLAGSSTDLRFYIGETRRLDERACCRTTWSRSIDRSGAKKLRFFQLYSLLFNFEVFRSWGKEMLEFSLRSASSSVVVGALGLSSLKFKFQSICEIGERFPECAAKLLFFWEVNFDDNLTGIADSALFACINWISHSMNILLIWS